MGIKRITQLMRENLLQAKATRKYKTTTDSQHNLLVAPNLLQQQFSCDKPNKPEFCLSLNDDWHSKDTIVR